MEYSPTGNINHDNEVAMLHESIAVLKKEKEILEEKCNAEGVQEMVEKLNEEFDQSQERVSELENINKELSKENWCLRDENCNQDNIHRYLRLRQEMTRNQVWDDLLNDIDDIIQSVYHCSYIHDLIMTDCLEHLIGGQVQTIEEIKKDFGDEDPFDFEEFKEEHAVYEVPWKNYADGDVIDDDLYWWEY